jgi:hypothetical protein
MPWPFFDTQHASSHEILEICLLSAIRKLIPATVKRNLRRAWLTARRSARMQSASQVASRHRAGRERPVILFFTPEAGVTPYLIIQSYLARTLQSQGCDILFVRCFDLLPRCPVKDMLGLAHTASAAEQMDACLYCLDTSRRLLDKYGLDFFDLREIVDPGLIEQCKRALPVGEADRFDFHYKGINVGRLAFYDYAIVYKHQVDRPLDPGDRSRLDMYILNAVISIEIFDRLRDMFSIQSVVCFDVYAMMSAVRLRARDAGISSRMVRPAYHFNADAGRLICSTGLASAQDQQWLLSLWNKWKSLPLEAGLVAEITSDLIFRLSGTGTHIYSPNKTSGAEQLYDNLQLDRGRRLVVAYTSSRDEHDAMLVSLKGLGLELGAAADAFEDMFDWLHALIEHVEKSADLQLVVRIHPRVGATPRDGVASPDYLRYREQFSGEYRNSRIIWPDQQVSSYDIAEFADVVTVAWSSIGLEAARMGIPVISGHRSIISIGPGEQFIWHAATRQDYFTRLAALSRQTSSSIGNIRLALRWYRLAFLANSIDLTDSGLTMHHQPEFSPPRNAWQVKEILTGSGNAAEFNLATETARYNAGADKAERDELNALLMQTGRFIAFLCTGKDPCAGLKLIAAAAPARAGEVNVDNDKVGFHDGARLWTRRSPLVARLIRMCLRSG